MQVVHTAVRTNANERAATDKNELVLRDLKVMVVAIGEVIIDFSASSDQAFVVGEVLDFEIVDFTYDVFRSSRSGVIEIVHCVKMVVRDMLVWSVISHRNARSGRARKKRSFD